MSNSTNLEEILKRQKITRIDIPIQSGNSRILKLMHRFSDVERIKDTITRLKRSYPNLKLSTDILVGFPGENDENFRNTVRCLKEILPLRTHIFSFSPREGTVAFNLPGRIEPKMIKERVNLLKGLAAECSYKFRKRFLERHLRVLIESKVDKQSGFLCGYSENYIRVIVEDATEKDINNLV